MKTEEIIGGCPTDYDALFTQVKTAALLIDPADGCIVDANLAAAAFYGWPCEMLRAMRISEINTLTPAEISKEMARARTERRSFFNFRHRLANGTVRDVEVHSGPVILDGRSLLYSQIFDVSARASAEAALREREHNLRALTEQAHDAVIQIDENGAITLWNGAAERIFGFAPSEAMGKPVTLIMPEDLKASHMAAMEQAFAGGASDLVGRTVEVRGRHKSGREMPVEVSLARMTVDGRVRFAAIVRDITERKGAEQELRRLNAELEAQASRLAILAEEAEEERRREQRALSFLSTVMEAVPIPIFYKDLEGNYQGFNQAFVDFLGRTREEMAGHTVESVQPADLAGVHKEAEKLLLDTGVGQRYETRVESASGVMRDVVFTKALFRDEDGRPAGIVAAMMDITERKQLEKKLRDQASTDSLTGVLIRRSYEEAAQAELVRAARFGRELSMIMIDVDHFKVVNDTHGHDVGDDVLCALVKAFQDGLRQNVDLIGRLGGEEFVVLLPETGLSAAAGVAERMRLRVHDVRVTLPCGTVLGVTCSFGVAAWTEQGEDLHEFARRADQALLEAKRNGRDRVVEAA